MKVDVDTVDESRNGWQVCISVDLSSEELSRLNTDSIAMIEDFTIDQKDSNLFFNCFLNTAEPWEDETLEELLKAIKFEVEYYVNALLE
ncbi:hypothetical protein [Methanobacterium petrolearium]|uniref:hypothetical protein n=1 Tax=Methanobacterium petrolearium TaxID=710190 RepID=UPI001AE2A909|nr:hypothetical protein [Methanobacterium petrolearium]MBP1946259.1 hypothetical protein [Methanobacterium petrolearium]BDZ71348.1 hypothetical protein GCM10025861_18650 [Methanobacterium petrolearium]